MRNNTNYTKCFLFVLATFLFFVVSAHAQYVVDVQVVDLQISVSDGHGNYVTDLKPEDFLVYEDDAPQEVLDLELDRQPFSIGIVLDTSGSMRSAFLLTKRATLDFLHSLQQQDEFFVLTFDEKIMIRRDLTTASTWTSDQWKELRYGTRTRMYEALITAIEHLQSAHHPRRAVFLISDGYDTMSTVGLNTVVETAQKNKVIVYSILLQDFFMDLSVLRILSEKTGGTCFTSYEKFPRLQAAYQKIASDLAQRVTLYYRSRSDYTKIRKPEIKVKMKNPAWRVQYQK